MTKYCYDITISYMHAGTHGTCRGYMYVIITFDIVCSTIKFMTNKFLVTTISYCNALKRIIVVCPVIYLIIIIIVKTINNLFM